jgi:hypothetical protein
LLQWKAVIPGLAAEDHNVVLASALLFRTFNRPEVACEYCTGTASSRIAAGAHFGQPGYETDLLYLAGLAALVLGGSEPLALDHLVLQRENRNNHK